MAETFRWNGAGYHFNIKPDPAVLGAAGLAHPDPWVRLATALEQAKCGDFSGARCLQGLMQGEGGDAASLMVMAVSLFGDMAPEAELPLLVEVMHSPYPYIAASACQAALRSGRLRFAPDVLACWHRINASEHGVLSLCLSEMLEAEPGPVFDHERFDDAHAYGAAVQGRIDELEAAYGSDALVFRGEPLTTAALVGALERALAPVGAAGDLGAEVSGLRHRLEARTGLDCRSFFRRHQVQPAAVAAWLKRLREASPQGLDARPGLRLFWGRVVP